MLNIGILFSINALTVEIAKDNRGKAKGQDKLTKTKLKFGFSSP